MNLRCAWVTSITISGPRSLCFLEALWKGPACYVVESKGFQEYLLTYLEKKDQDVEEPGNENGDINSMSMKYVSKHTLMGTDTERRNTISVHFSWLWWSWVIKKKVAYPTLLKAQVHAWALPLVWEFYGWWWYHERMPVERSSLRQGAKDWKQVPHFFPREPALCDLGYHLLKVP